MSWTIKKMGLDSMQTCLRQQIRDEVNTISAWDDLERQHIEHTLNWIDSGAPLFRIARPARMFHQHVAC